jgi:lysophospholipase L1-like esterase
MTARIEVAPPTMAVVTFERYASLPVFIPNAGGWLKGARLRGLLAQECTTAYLLDPASLQLRAESDPAALVFENGKDYAADLVWGTVGRLADGRIAPDQPVFASYVHAQLRLDTIVLTRRGQLVLRQGEPRPAAPLPPTGEEGDRPLANIWLSGRLSQLGPDNLFPILESAYPEPVPVQPSAAERFLPKSLQKLRDGQPLRLLAWGDSVTEGSYVPETARWQSQFVGRLRARFPQAKVELLTEAWGGRNTASYLAEPPGSAHNYAEKVLGAKPDLIVSEFVNDAGLSPQQVEERYNRLRQDFTQAGAEWIILTPHYVRPDWMGLPRERDIDEDPRPYVAGLRQFAARHGIALADASLRYGRLWRQGLPYTTLMLNSINHPDARGLGLFADSLLALFP